MADALARRGVATAINVISTAGDTRAPDTSWGEGAFVTAIEAALAEGRIDVAVHSAKDLPTDEDRRLLIAAFLPRAPAGDVLVLPTGAARVDSIAELPSGARVGTDSPRRTAFLRAERPDLVFHPLHGNVDTRLRRLDDGNSDVLVLAEAGLERLGRGERVSLRLDPTLVPPAPGQGALAVQVRAGDATTFKTVEALDDLHTRRAVEAERDLLAATGGGCRAPIGALARSDDDGLSLVAGYAREDGSVRVFVNGRIDAPSGVAATDDPDDRLTLDALHELADKAARAAMALHEPPVIVTRAADQAPALALALVDRGLAPLVVPAIEIESGDVDRIDDALEHFLSYDWVVVTSANTVAALEAGARRTGADLAGLGATGPRWAAVGNATRRSLARVGVAAAFVPAASSAGALADALPIEAGDRVLFPRSDVAEQGPIDRLAARGAWVDAPVAYRTLEAPESSVARLRDAIELGPVATILTSGSTARGFLALARMIGAADRVLAIPAICLGPETAARAGELGYRVAAAGPVQRVGGIADLVARSLSQPGPQNSQVEVTR